MFVVDRDPQVARHYPTLARRADRDHRKAGEKELDDAPVELPWLAIPPHAVHGAVWSLGDLQVRRLFVVLRSGAGLRTKVELAVQERDVSIVDVPFERL